MGDAKEFWNPYLKGPDDWDLQGSEGTAMKQSHLSTSAMVYELSSLGAPS